TTARTMTARQFIRKEKVRPMLRAEKRAAGRAGVGVTAGAGGRGCGSGGGGEACGSLMNDPFAVADGGCAIRGGGRAHDKRRGAGRDALGGAGAATRAAARVTPGGRSRGDGGLRSARRGHVGGGRG